MMHRRYKFTICKVDGEWMDLDDVIAEDGFEGVDETEECFDVEVWAKNWKDAREKILIAAEALQRYRRGRG